MKKKILAAVMAAAMTAGLLAGCATTVETTGSKDTGASEKTETTTETAAAGETETTEQTTEEAAGGSDISADITLWTYPIGSWGNAEVVNSLVEDFNKEYPGIHVSVEYLDYANGDDQVNIAIEGGQAPDLIMEGPSVWLPTGEQRD